jgi:hypothetical protein
METIIVILAVVGLLAGFDILALRFGTDSRDGVADTWGANRSSGTL